VIETLSIVSFWVAAGLLAYAYVVFPALLLAVGRLNRASRATPAAASWPDVAVIIAAFNEEKHIVECVRNVLDQDYPPDRLVLLIGSDGSTDSTVEVARRAGNERVHIRSFPRNRGKASVLNDLIAESTQAVIVFSDANTCFERETVRKLVARFADTEVGAVCGELVLTAPERSRNEDHRYWRIEQRLKAAESDIGGLLGANGGVYAIRRELYQPLKAETICDDFVIVMHVAVAGMRVVYESMARAFEESPMDMAAEFDRRVRIGVGNYQVLFGYPAFLKSTNASRRWTYVSHKVLRWVTPHLLLVMLVASGLAMSHRPYALLFGSQVVAYLAAWIVYATRHSISWPGILRLSSLFVVINLAFGIAFIRFLRGGDTGGWRRTER
jgi:cellulose synthase/poly-beta-1,6-N-acetylglucosamine synthase-like glycosyltransferase